MDESIAIHSIKLAARNCVYSYASACRNVSIN